MKQSPCMVIVRAHSAAVGVFSPADAHTFSNTVEGKTTHNRNFPTFVQLSKIYCGGVLVFRVIVRFARLEARS